MYTIVIKYQMKNLGTVGFPVFAFYSNRIYDFKYFDYSITVNDYISN